MDFLKLKACPVCGEENIVVTDDSVICGKCQTVSKGSVFAKIYNLPARIIRRMLRHNEYGVVPEDYTIIATSNNYRINAYDSTEEKSLYNFPTIYPCMREEGNVTIVDNPALLPEAPPNTIAFDNGWLAMWSSNLSGRNVTLLRDKLRRSEAEKVAQSLVENGAIVKFGDWKGDFKSSIKRASLYNVNPTIEIDRKGQTLKEVIDEFHYVAQKQGQPRYKETRTGPAHKMTDAVIEWFKDNGGKFLWDEAQKKGYLKYDNKLYELDPHNIMLRSLLFTLGGVTTSQQDGRIILDALCCMALQAEKVEPTSWLHNDLSEDKIIISQGASSIIITQNDVFVRPSEGIDYSQIRRTWFKPIELKSGDGLTMLRDYIMRHLVVPNTAKEIIICWLVAIFLQGYSSIRPGIHLRGPAGSGKSTLMKILYWLIYGDNEEKLPTYTTAGLWRTATVEPLLFFDNENVTDVSEGLRTFFDMAATGGRRVIGSTSGGGTSTHEQQAHSFVMISGLDNFLQADVRTRYYEIETDFKYQDDFYGLKDKKLILNNREIILTSILKLISEKVLPDIHEFMSRQRVREYKEMLGVKERTVDYFMLMVLVGKKLQEEKIIGEGDLATRWSKYILSKSAEASIRNSETIEWFKNLKLALIRSDDDSIIKRDENLVIRDSVYNLIIEEDKVFGISGTPEEILNALSWTARTLHRRCPWRSKKHFEQDILRDEHVYSKINWMLKFEDDMITVKWQKGV